MIIVKTKNEVLALSRQARNIRKSVGFVPTMGALHYGHISLIEASKKSNGFTICSIFVNPTQFNNPDDFAKYPITIEKDINMLEAAGCDVLFFPTVNEMYPSGDEVAFYELGYLDTILEGKFRPGHYQGVCRIVDKLLLATEPDNLYLGQKDFQQCMVIKKMIEIKQHKTKVVICETIREQDGLAMSSRNMRLNEQERSLSLAISQALLHIKLAYGAQSPEALIASANDLLEQNGFKTDYISISDANTLEPITSWNKDQKAVALIAAFMNDVRLIDNMILN